MKRGADAKSLDKFGIAVWFVCHTAFLHIGRVRKFERRLNLKKEKNEFITVKMNSNAINIHSKL